MPILARKQALCHLHFTLYNHKHNAMIVLFRYRISKMSTFALMYIISISGQPYPKEVACKNLFY
ncbi:hypothetical protein D8W73_09420 [Citrobacter amalonaticus]|nr:hypothetical protein [Citrobacter amalonaticus]